MDVYILFDVGGTEIKINLLTPEKENVFSEFKKYPSLANRNRDEIFSHFVQILKDVYEPSYRVLGIGMAFPGPFDYKRGISLMKGISKYDQIYGFVIPEEIRKRCAFPWIQRVPFLFLHDVAAFALGVCRMDSYREYFRIMHLCIGTGAGSAFTQGGLLITESKEVPLHGWIYNAPFKDSCIDDYISVRGFHRLSESILGRPMDGYEAQKCADQGDTAVRDLFLHFGKYVIQAIQPFLEEFQPDALVLGGQMTKGFPYFGKPLLEWCAQHNIYVGCEYNTSKVAFTGLLYEFENQEGIINVG